MYYIASMILLCALELAFMMCNVSVTAMHCYQCDSKNHPDCKEFFDWEHEDTITIRSDECTVDAAEYCIKTTGVWGGRKS